MYDKTADSMSTLASRDVEAPRSAFGDASGALEEARNLAFRVADMVDRLCGPQPQAVNAASKSGNTGSVLSNLRDESERTIDCLRAAMSQLNRLDRELP